MYNKKQKLYKIGISAIISAVFLFLIYLVMNWRIPISEEKIKLQAFEIARRVIWPSSTVDMSDSVLLVDIHYDKTMVLERDSDKMKTPNGYVSVTDKSKLFQFLSYLKECNNYKYILLDVYLEESVSQDSDTALYRLIASMPRIVIPVSPESNIADTCLSDKTGMAQYGMAIWENDFVKYPFYTNGNPSIPLKMYQEMTGNNITRHGLVYTDKGLVRNSVILAYEYVYEEDELDIYQLGTGILGDSIEGNSSGSMLNNMELAKDKYVLIGDFKDDVHTTFVGDLAGTMINFNAYLSLLHGHHRISLWLIVLLFLSFWLLSFVTLNSAEKYKIIRFWIYPIFLLGLCIITYLVLHEVYDVFVTTTLFWALEGSTTIYQKIKTKNQI